MWIRAREIVPSLGGGGGGGRVCLVGARTALGTTAAATALGHEILPGPVVGRKARGADGLEGVVVAGARDLVLLLLLLLGMLRVVVLCWVKGRGGSVGACHVGLGA